MTNPRTLHFLTVVEVALLLKISTKTVRRRIKGGDLHAHLIGGQLRISEEDLTAYLAQTRK